MVNFKNLVKIKLFLFLFVNIIKNNIFILGKIMKHSTPIVHIYIVGEIEDINYNVLSQCNNIIDFKFDIYH